MSQNQVYQLNHAMPIFSKVRFGRILLQIISLINAFRNYFVSETKLISGVPGMQEGTSTTTKSRMNAAIRYMIGGQNYYAPAAEVVLAAATNDITATKFGAFRFQINALGVLTCDAADEAVDMAYESAELALLALANQALTANTLVVGYLTIQAAAGGFTIGTDLPVTSDAQVTAAVYYDELGDSGLISPATLAVSATPEEFAIGASTVKVNGVQLAEVAADATFPFPLADTVTTLLYGGWLIVTDLAGTAHLIISADGDPTASLQAYASFAAVKTALDALEAAVPGKFVVLGRFYLQNGAKAPWTAITDDIVDGIDIVDGTFRTNAAYNGIQRLNAETAVDVITGSVSS